MKSKIIRFYFGVLAGIGIAVLLFRPDLFKEEIPTIQGEFQIKVNVPKRDTTCYGNDIESLSREEVQALNEQRNPTVTYENEHRKAFANICRQEFDSCLWAKKDYETYDIENDAEYFADAFSFCFVECGELNNYWEQYCPASHKYMSNLVTEFNYTERGD